MPLPALADWQFGLASLSFAFGRADTGNDYDATVEGLIDINVEMVTVGFETADGEYLARKRRTSNQAIFTVTIDQPDASSASPIVDAFLTAWDSAPEDEHLRWKVPGIANERYVIGACGRAATPFDEDGADVGLVTIKAEFLVPIPVIRDAVTDAVVRY